MRPFFPYGARRFDMRTKRLIWAPLPIRFWSFLVWHLFAKHVHRIAEECALSAAIEHEAELHPDEWEPVEE